MDTVIQGSLVSVGSVELNMDTVIQGSLVSVGSVELNMDTVIQGSLVSLTTRLEWYKQPQSVQIKFVPLATV
ncbi:hypothetical protein LSAT2_009967, partial [Lamellibrachia satsuma]